jgi:predicted nucleic-acid-binding protein
MIAIDTNILARFYCDDPQDIEAKRQRPFARWVMLESKSIFVPITVIVEFEWVMRGFYEVPRTGFCAAVTHLLGIPHATVDRWQAVKDALHTHAQGLDFADALHLACSSACTRFLSFDDKGFVRRANRLGLKPQVTIPNESHRKSAAP